VTATPSASSASSPIERLRFERRFVDSLPGDPLRDNARRQVLGACYSHVTPTPVSAPELVALVPEAAALLGLDPTPSDALVEVLAGNRVVPGMTPYAACYGGHQFGNWAGQLGDGRAITLAEVRTEGDASWEVQIKGAGPTPYSRGADGRAVLRSSLRELVCSEAMHHLGVPTTRALSLVKTGDRIERDMLYDGHPRLEPGAVVCRLAPSFLRFGSYEIHAARDDLPTLARLVRFTAERHYPSLSSAGGAVDLGALLEEIARRTARLVIDWMRVGFVHGVMNTDNMSILGLTIDYGPYGWLEPYDPDWTPNTTDAAGRRYRFGNQPSVAFWNLVRLGNALAQLCESDEEIPRLERALRSFAEEYEPGYRRMMLAKIGLRDRDDRRAEDDELLGRLTRALTSTEVDMTLFFRGLADVSSAGATVSAGAKEALAHVRAALYDETADTEPIADWLGHWLTRVRDDGASDDDRGRRMNAVNPLYVPRNYLVQEVIDETEADDGGRALAELLDVLRRPYDARAGRERFAEKRPEWARHRVGCSMLSCSS
jgi:uncharacterized protein YdiU (UPF0061 family)